MLFPCLFHSLNKGCSSGAVGVETEGLLFCALYAKSFSFCTNCIDFDLDLSDLDIKTISFKCPQCFLKEDKKGIYVRSLTQYYSINF